MKITNNITFFRQAYYIPVILVLCGAIADIQYSVTSNHRFQGG